MQKIKNDKLEKCSLCNFCRVSCPIFYSTKKEVNSPRSRAIKLKKDILDRDFFKCSLCGYCNFACPNDVDFEIISNREKLNELGYETQANKEMIENVRKYGNPFGQLRNNSDNN